MNNGRCSSCVKESIFKYLILLDSYADQHPVMVTQISLVLKADKVHCMGKFAFTISVLCA